MKQISVLCLVMLLCGCMGPAPVTPPRTPMQVRQVQTREYQVSDPKIVMKSLLNVLQDEGYITRNAVTDLGLITASKEIDRESRNEVIWRSILMGENATWAKSELIEATANVSRFGEQTRVRVSFQHKLLDNRGAVISVSEIEDAHFFQDFFSKVDKGIFIEKQRI